MASNILILSIYFAAVLALGFIVRGRAGKSPGDYFLAGRGFGVFVLLGTMTATNFSAFTVFGASGAGYRHGLAFFPIMGFGTGFMALSFWVIGRKIHKLGRLRNLITPAELIQDRYGSRPLSAAFALVMVAFTIPYLALQPMAGGYVLKELFGLPQAAGAALVTGVILVYTLRGGLRAVAWTDVLQGVLLTCLLAAALFVAAAHHGGLANGLSKAFSSHPELFSRPGGQGRFGPGIWLSYLMLWFFCDPMFPQLFQRFYTAKNERALGLTMLLYPLVCTVVFAMPVLLGVLGRLTFPDLTGKQADSIVPMLMTAVAGDFMGALVLAAGLAALMSTMDSQLLTLSSIFTRDLFPLVSRGKTGTTAVGRVFACLLALSGLAMAVNPPDTILQIATWAFTGLAVLFPTVLFGIYLDKPRAAPALASIITGEALVVLYMFNLLPSFGFLPAVPVIAGAFLAYLAVHGCITRRISMPRPASWWPWAAVFGAIFLAAMDFWRFGATGPLYLGFPAWLWHFAALSGLQTAAMAFLVFKRPEPGRSARPGNPLARTSRPPAS